MIHYKAIFKDMMRHNDSSMPAYDFSRLENIKKNLDVLEINQAIRGNNVVKPASNLRSYTQDDVLHILKYQKENQLNRTQTAHHFKMSTTTLTKWLKCYKLVKATNSNQYVLEKK